MTNIQYTTDTELLVLLSQQVDLSESDLEQHAALIKALDLTLEEAKTIKIEDNIATIECNNQEYLIGTDESWKEDAKHDGRAYSLSNYDGLELEAEINSMVYYIYRQC